MSSHLSAEVKRPVVSFRSSIWGNRFINYTPDDEITRAYNQQRVEDLKEEVKRELMVAAGKPSQHLNFIDAVQRLGMAYHFEEEIEEAIGHIYDNYHHSDDKYDDLCNVSLRFRLLRQQGYNISCDIFERFKDENGSFKECLNNDVEGMLGLYEAAHLRVQEEDILDEALAFTTAHLESLVEDLDYPLAAQATQALYRPIRKGLERLEARPHISIYQDEASHSKALLELAKLDFNLLQSLYKKELSYITRWWKDLDFSSKLPFVRDRVVETYLWIVAECFEPQYSYARRIQTKLLVLITVIDDVYDAYGTLEELELFTEAIERWDNNSIDSLPEYMKPCYQAVLDVYKEIEEKENEERPYCVHYAKKAVRSVRAYFNEGKWLHAEYVPTMEEYMGVALVSSDVPMFTIISFVGMGMMATKEAFDWVLNGPKIVRACSTIVRLMDLKYYFQNFEQERGHSASSVECYMKQNSVSEQLAYRELNKQVEKAWKDINQEFLRPTAIPMHLLTRVLNFARTGEFILKIFYSNRSFSFCFIWTKAREKVRKYEINAAFFLWLNNDRLMSYTRLYMISLSLLQGAVDRFNGGGGVGFPYHHKIINVGLQNSYLRRSKIRIEKIFGKTLIQLLVQITLAYNQQRIEDLKEEVRRELMAAAGKPSQQLNFIDAVQRLGVAYHFEEEIEEALGRFNISCDTFKRFTDENGSFKECLIKDVEGMLGLYEAAHLRVQEEDILDEAIAFTTTHLRSLVEHLDCPLAAPVNRALYRPIRKCLERLEARPYITMYQDEASHSKDLLELAKLDFNQLQSLYKKELSHITRWWKDLDFSSKLPFFRDRAVETYLWIAVACFEPQYSYARRIQAKLLAIATVIDDMYDAYGTPEELELFTEAIERYDIKILHLRGG
ncbi:unnamed protein product, partial [Vitis vinifera]